ncbi:MAG: penicillin-binding protein 2 [Alphaproteobacteria bacterium]|nr:penicillin-binding protein 2 [Alphaproteobacteria bacterium]
MPSLDLDRGRTFTRRAFVVGGAQALAMALLTGRMVQLQLIESEKFQQLADNNRLQLRLIAPPRGQILDRSGVVIANTTQSFKAIIHPASLDDLTKTLAIVEGVVPLGEAMRQKLMREWRQHRSPQGLMVFESLTWDELTRLELQAHQLPTLEILPGEVRHYPLGEVTSHVLGYVGLVTEEEQQQSTAPILRVPGFRIGKSGLEKSLDETLRGQPGRKEMEVNAHGEVMRDIANVPPRQGQHVSLTLHAGLQQYVHERLSTTESAAAVVLHARTGAVLALCSTPSFDPNKFTFGIRSDDWNAYMADERNPLSNKCIAGQFAPGSTFKMITALAGWEAGVIRPHKTVFCPGHYDLGSHRFHCWKKGGHGTVGLRQAIAQSCDTYFYEMGRRTGIDKIASMARRFGMGEKTGIELVHERAGLVPDTVWKLTRKREMWQAGETLINAIGQGFMLATPLQLAVMMARMCNGGFAVQPHLQLSRDVETPRSLGLSPEALTSMVDACHAVTVAGTASAHRMEDGLTWGGKTGTSQVRSISKAERASGIIPNHLRPWRERDHALFVGYAPHDKPQLAMSVIVEHGGGGGAVAAPLARDILQWGMRNITNLA